MANIFAIVLAAACILSTQAIPVPKAIDWDAARAKVDEIQIKALNENLEKVIAIANKDNPDACIDSICFAYVVNRYHIDRIRRHTRNLEFWIYDQTLTTQLVAAALGEVRYELGRLLGLALDPYLALLTEPAVAEIKIYFDKATQATYQYQGELYAILLEGQQQKQQ